MQQWIAGFKPFANPVQLFAKRVRVVWPALPPPLACQEKCFLAAK